MAGTLQVSKLLLFPSVRLHCLSSTSQRCFALAVISGLGLRHGQHYLDNCFKRTEVSIKYNHDASVGKVSQKSGATDLESVPRFYCTQKTTKKIPSSWSPDTSCFMKKGNIPMPRVRVLCYLKIIICNAKDVGAV